MRKLATVIFVLGTLLGVHAEPPTQVGGSWTLVYGKTNNVAELVQDGDRLTGKLFSKRGSTHAPINGTVQGSKVRFGVPKEQARNPMAPQFEGTVEGSTMKGFVKFGPSRMPFSGTRK